MLLAHILQLSVMTFDFANFELLDVHVIRPTMTCYLFVILPGKLTENTFSFEATTWGIVTGARRGMNEPIVNWGLLGDRDGLMAN